MKYAILFFAVTTNLPIPAFTYGPSDRREYVNVYVNAHQPGAYGIGIVVPPGFDVDAYRMGQLEMPDLSLWAIGTGWRK